MKDQMSEEQMSFLNELVGDVEVPLVEPAKVEPEPQSAQVEDTTSAESATQIEDAKEQKVDTSNELGAAIDVDESKDNKAPEDIQATLREQIVKLTEQLQRDPYQQTVQSTVTTETEKDGKATEQAIQAFLTEEEIDRIIDEPQLLNIGFNRVIAALQQNIQHAIQSEVNRQVMVSRAVTDFYTANNDLAPYGKFVQYVMAEMESLHPQKTYEDIFKLTASESRKRLGLTQVEQGTRTQSGSQSGKQKPAFAGTKQGTQRPAGQKEFFDPNAADLMNLL